MFSSPKLHGLQDGRSGKNSVPIIEPHAQVHRHVSLEENVAVGEDGGAEQSILYQTNDRTIRLGGDDLLRNVHDLEQLSLRLVRLRDVHVHLVSVEVGVVGRGDAKIQAERLVTHHANPVGHHTHLVERGLTIEDDNIAVIDVTLDSVSNSLSQVPNIQKKNRSKGRIEANVRILVLRKSPMKGARAREKGEGPRAFQKRTNSTFCAKRRS